jgi:hypothetical protein
LTLAERIEKSGILYNVEGSIPDVASMGGLD